jgi:hypothetical protein
VEVHYCNFMIMSFDFSRIYHMNYNNASRKVHWDKGFRKCQNNWKSMMVMGRGGRVGFDTHTYTKKQIKQHHMD